MEENRPFIPPPPPPRLRQVQPNAEPKEESTENSLRTDLQKADLLNGNLDKIEEKTFQPFEEERHESAERGTGKHKGIDKGFLFALTNWCGLFISCALAILFLILLFK